MQIKQCRCSLYLYFPLFIPPYKQATIANGGNKPLEGIGNGVYVWQYNTSKVISSSSSGSISKAINDLDTAIKADENLVVTVTGSPLTGTEAEKHEYEIAKAMEVNFGGSEAQKLTINTKASGTIVVRNLTVKEVEINAPYANVVFDNVVVTGTTKDEGKIALKNICQHLRLQVVALWFLILV